MLVLLVHIALQQHASGLPLKMQKPAKQVKSAKLDQLKMLATLLFVISYKVSNNLTKILA